MAGAASEALLKLFPGQAAMLNRALTDALNKLPTNPSTIKGLALGRAVATAELALRSDDGSASAASYTPSDRPGLWRPTPPALANALLPGWGKVTPFLLDSPSQYRPPAPPAITSAEYARAVNEVKGLGAVNSATRTPDQTQIALFWADGSGTETPPGHWNTIAGQVAARRGLSLLKTARAFALLDAALADAAIACWDSKYADDLWRPITAIRLADTDDNPATTADPAWSPLLATPPFPSYVSGHSTFSGTAATVLSALFGARTSFTTTSDALPGVSRSFKSFDAAADEAGMSRIYGGIHYRFDNEAGLALGRSIGRFAVQRGFGKG